MSLDDAINELNWFTLPAVPDLRYIRAAVEKVHKRWPDVVAALDPREREKLAIQLRDRVAQNNWTDARISFVLAAAQAVFDPERRDRKDLHEARVFLIEEVRVSTSETFLSGMLSVYLESFVAGAAHTQALSKALNLARHRLSSSLQQLIEKVPELLDAIDGPRRLAARMTRCSDPYGLLVGLGMRNPHGAGFMEQAHIAMTAIIRSELSRRDRIDWYIDWLRPPGRAPRTIGAERSIEALAHPWLNNAPSDELRSHLVETLIEMYGDPRIRDSSVWAGVNPVYRRVIDRWLTREDMRFFTGVVDAAQKDPMWPRRRDFWLQLFDEKRIDAAWVAFSSQATDYARAHLMRQDARNADTRFGYQQARQNTSLLIMRIGNKIMVDGCHNYKTHVFSQDDPMAPKLFQEGYDCEEIRLAAPESKSHSSIEAWKRWVRDMINADVKWSESKRPYSKVYRPRTFHSRDASSQRPYIPYQPRHEQPVERQLNLENRPQNRMSPGSITQSMPTRPQARTPPTLRSVVANTSVSASGERGQASIDRLLAAGPPAAKALLDHFSHSKNKRTRALLSPKARAALEWLQIERAPLPPKLHNALTHLLVSMAKSEQDPVEIISPVQPASDVTPVELADLPPLPANARQRMELLSQNVEAMEAFARERYDFSKERVLSTALIKLKDRNLNLRPIEIGPLQQIYEQMRKNAKRGRR